MVRVETQILDGDGPGALAQERDVLAVAAEVRDVCLHPAHSRELVVQAEVPVPPGAAADLLMGQVAQHAQAVIGKHRHDPAPGKL